MGSEYPAKPLNPLSPAGCGACDNCNSGFGCIHALVERSTGDEGVECPKAEFVKI